MRHGDISPSLGFSISGDGERRLTAMIAAIQIKAHFGGLLPVCLCIVNSSYEVGVLYLGGLENEPISWLVNTSTEKEETVE